MPRTAGTTAEDTRARILDVALQLVTERGYAGMSIRDLADHLDLTTAAMYYHFASKEALLDALVEPLTDGLDELAATSRAGGLPAEQVLTQLVALLSGPGARALPVLMSDPSAGRLLKSKIGPMRAFESILEGLAASPDRLDLLRARCAMSAVQGAVMTCAHAQRGRGEQWAGFTDEEGRVVVVAALAALHSGASQ
jgi:AcrR family transcriptional regulator